MARPVGAAVLTIIGGIFIIIGGFIIALIGALFAFLGFFSGIFFVGIVVGVLTLLMGILMLALPSAHLPWGIITILLAIVSIPFALGGFLIGFILALIGGILSIVWKRPVDRVINVEARLVPPPSK